MWREFHGLMTFTDTAAKKAKSFMGDEDFSLRVFVTGGGCSGFEYGFTFDEDIEEEDSTFENDGVQLVVDSLSYQYLEGAEIDFLENLQGARFVVTNPNAETTCGCGNSFSI